MRDFEYSCKGLRGKHSSIIAVLRGDIGHLWDAFDWAATKDGDNYWLSKACGNKLSNHDKEQLAIYLALCK